MKRPGTTVWTYQDIAEKLRLMADYNRRSQVSEFEWLVLRAWDSLPDDVRDNLAAQISELATENE